MNYILQFRTNVKTIPHNFMSISKDEFWVRDDFIRWRYDDLDSKMAITDFLQPTATDIDCLRLWQSVS